jgi:asparagine N-glycosylation enzyme membrane subunit Stt3
VLRSLHANVRFTSAFIFPLAVLGAYVFHRVFDGTKWVRTAAFLVGLSTLLLLSLYLPIPEDVHIRSFNLNSALPTYARLDTGWNFTLQNVAEITDMQVFQQQDSNLASQDPMFGYRGEYFKPRAVVGPILAVTDGYYNLTNPAGYVFPEENDLQPFDLFREDQKADLELFINHRQPMLALSGWQKFADAVSLLALVGSVLYLVFVSINGSRRVWQMNAR